MNIRYRQVTHKNIGMIYEISSAIAVNEKIAFAATGLAKSSKPGSTLKIVVAQIARRGVCVLVLTRPSRPPSGSPWSRLKAYTVREHACSAVWHTKKAVKHTNTYLRDIHKSLK